MHAHVCTGITPGYTSTHSEPRKSRAPSTRRLRRGRTTRAQRPADAHAGTGMAREPSNPPQSRAPPRGPAARGATSERASGRLQIRPALSPPAGSGDPPPLPSAPAPLRAAAPSREGSGPPRRGPRGQALLPRARTGPCSWASRASVETQEPRHSQPRRGALQPDAAACAASAGARPGGCRAFRSPAPTPALPSRTGMLSRPGAAYGPLARLLGRQNQPLPAADPVSIEQPNTHGPGPWVTDPRATPTRATANSARPGSHLPPQPPSKGPFLRPQRPLTSPRLTWA